MKKIFDVIYNSVNLVNYNTKMADCILFLVKIFRKPSKVRKKDLHTVVKGLHNIYIILKVLSNKTNLIFIPISLYKGIEM
jgi:hypothetical protein